jgi:hypothetical protein
VEIEDLPWCPAGVRDSATDYLQFSINLFKLYRSLTPRLCHALQQSGAQRIIDLCSGGGGPWLHLHAALHDAGVPVRVCLTDLYPNTEAFERIQRATGHAIEVVPTPVNAMQVPAELPGFRTLFSSVHHFRPDEVRAILHDAVLQQQGIGLFDAVQRNPRPIMAALLVVPLTSLLVTPFIRPFRWSRLFWTYAISAVPLVLAFDGMVSCLRAYTPDELRALVASLGETGYTWEIGQEHEIHSAAVITYLVGYPASPSRQSPRPGQRAQGESRVQGEGAVQQPQG